MKPALVVLFLAASAALYAQQPEVLTNQTIARMVASGVPVDAIVQTINNAPAVNFVFTPAQLAALAQAQVPENVVKAMAARDARVANAAQAAAAAPPPQPVQPAPQQRRAITNFDADPDEYQGQGMWDVGFNGTAAFPHYSTSAWSASVNGYAGYFLTRGNEVGPLVLASFFNGGGNVALGGMYRYYFNASSRVLPFVGVGAGANVAHLSRFGTATNFVAVGTGGVRFYVAPRIALELSYQLGYVRVSGFSFKDSTASSLAVGFSHVFGGR